jgi:hypothetical protein
VLDEDALDKSSLVPAGELYNAGHTWLETVLASLHEKPQEELQSGKSPAESTDTDTPVAEPLRSLLKMGFAKERVEMAMVSTQSKDISHLLDFLLRAPEPVRAFVGFASTSSPSFFLACWSRTQEHHLLTDMPPTIG